MTPTMQNQNFDGLKTAKPAALPLKVYQKYMYSSGVYFEKQLDTFKISYRVN